jgi:hypothetical protein
LRPSLQDRTAVQAEGERRLARFRQGKKHFLEGHWPGDSELKFKLAVLSCTEVGECRGAAFAHLKVDLKLDPNDVLNLDLYQDEVLTQILFRALRDFEDPSQPLAADAKDLRDFMTPDDRSALFDIYSDFRASVDPAPETMDADLYAAIIDAVKKKDMGSLLAFGGRKLAVFLTTGESPPDSSPTGKSESA